MAKTSKNTLNLARNLAKQLLTAMDEPKTTVDELFQTVWKEHWNHKQYIESGWAQEVERNYKKHIFPNFGNSILQNITTQEVKKWHSGLRDIPFAANRSLELLSKLYRYAQESSISTHNPCLGVKAFKEKRRNRYASEEEIRKICEILDREMAKHSTACIFIYALLYSGARPRSLEKAKWRDLKRYNGFGILTFKGKSTASTGEEEQLIFPPFVMDLIDKHTFFKQDVIFQTKMPRALWEKIRKEVGCPDLRARDLRRTFATVAMSSGERMDTISELLNHKSTQTTKIYAKLNDQIRIETVGSIAQKLISIVKR